jgi:hypothetical protein
LITDCDTFSNFVLAKKLHKNEIQNRKRYNGASKSSCG